MVDPNFKNRTFYHGDNLEFLRGINSETVHLIATDPPFNKNKDFHATPDSIARGARFKDRWNWDRDIHPEWWDAIKDDWRPVYEVIDAARHSYGDDMAAFLCWLGVRLIECHRILRPDGSLYLHIDHTAHAYVKCMLDGIFGVKNFRNEIVWCYSGGGIPRNDFPRKHDTILRYTKEDDYTFHTERKSYKENTQQVGIHSTLSGGDNKIDLTRGTPVTDWWVDVPTVTGWNPERTGFPTQKPVALYERIIKASSNEGDIVLDPFCGCATTVVAAERLNRQWIGMDIWKGAHDITLQRLEKEGLLSPNPTQNFLLTFGEIHYETKPPERTDDREGSAPDLILRYKVPKFGWERLTHAQIKGHLLNAQALQNGIACPGCGRVMEEPFMELDHILPRSDDGANDITNRILLCTPCNRKKKNTLTLSGLVKENKRDGWLYDRAVADNARSMARAKSSYIKDRWLEAP